VAREPRLPMVGWWPAGRLVRPTDPHGNLEEEPPVIGTHY